ncbi:Hypothetical predicted protein [Octopus vulgaris]|uniref:Cilia- and flagella-associated protein 54-like n=1 Tax=Octopus vulgaris TaxID=6645 RepID=A0AA36F1S5_OCTVU|nr:Hypothetical predicted protein [Octopus vulgaris]
MATNIRLKAAKLLNRQYPSSYYDAVGCKINPVFIAFKKEKEDFFNLFRNKPTDVPSVCGRPSITLFEMLKKYQPLLPQVYFLKQLLKIGNFLRDEEEYLLALSCYNFYFLESDISKCTAHYDLESYKKCFFPEGLQSNTAILTIQILIANYFCMYQIEKMHTLQTCQSADECEKILLSYQMLTQVLLPEKSYCWLLYNCTVLIYTICQDMMVAGHATKVLQYLIWACLCVENSPLLTDISFLSWRCTIYTAVCQCYWECKTGEHTEAFARRGLCKINDVLNVQKKSERARTTQHTAAIRECTLKMAIMIFKRVVFETRRKMKGFIRLKNRFSERDFVNLSWPRTNTEKLLVEMFDSESAQFLAIVESLSDSHIRLITPGGVFQGEMELNDVSLELFAAAKEIVSGNITANRSRKDSYTNIFTNVVHLEDNSLLELAILGENKIPMKAVFHLTVLAFCYEQWEFFINFAEFLQKIKDERYAWDVKIIQLLIVMEKLVHGRKVRKAQASASSPEADNEDDYEADISDPLQPTPSGYSALGADDLLTLTQVLKSLLTNNFCPAQVDLTVVLDVVYYLWNQTKVVLHRHQIGFENNSKYFQKSENIAKWLPILDVIFSVMCWCDVSSNNFTVFSEVTLRLALLLEVCANLTQGKKSWKDIEKKEMLLMSSSSPPEMSIRKEGNSAYSNLVEDSFIPSDIHLLTKEDFLRLARSILMKGLKDIDQARSLTAKQESPMSHSALAVKEVNNQVPETGNSVKTAAENVNKLIPKDQLLNFETPLCHFIRDQHTELLFIYYRVSCNLIRTDICPVKSDLKRDLQSSKKNSKKKKEDTSMVTYEMLLNECGSHNLLKALLKMQAAVVSNESKKEILQKSLDSLIKFQKEESKMYEVNNSVCMLDKEPTVPERNVPLPPILLWRSPSAMAFKPTKFKPSSGEKVCWYRLFAQIITTSYNKVRLNDTPVPGTGNLVPASYKEIIVTGMKTNQQYVFALGAYTSDGKLIGDNIGESTTPILVSSSLSIPLTYVFLCQISYQLKCFSISLHIFDNVCSHFVKHFDSPSTAENSSTVKKYFRKFPRKSA